MTGCYFFLSTSICWLDTNQTSKKFKDPLSASLWIAPFFLIISFFSHFPSMYWKIVLSPFFLHTRSGGCNSLAPTSFASSSRFFKEKMSIQSRLNTQVMPSSCLAIEKIVCSSVSQKFTWNFGDNSWKKVEPASLQVLFFSYNKLLFK